MESAIEQAEHEGHTIPEEALTILAEMKVAKAEKIDGCLSLLKNWEGLEHAIKLEEEALAKRRQALAARIDWLKSYLGYNLQEGEKYESARGKINWRKSESVEILDEQVIPEFYTKVEYNKKIDKKAIKDALKAGETVPGAELRQKNNLVIK